MSSPSLFLGSQFHSLAQPPVLYRRHSYSSSGFLSTRLFHHNGFFIWELKSLDSTIIIIPIIRQSRAIYRQSHSISFTLPTSLIARTSTLDPPHTPKNLLRILLHVEDRHPSQDAIHAGSQFQQQGQRDPHLDAQYWSQQCLSIAPATPQEYVIFLLFPYTEHRKAGLQKPSPSPCP